MNELEKAFRAAYKQSWEDQSRGHKFDEDAEWTNYKSELPPALAEPPKWTQEKPVEAGAYWVWMPDDGFSATYVELEEGGGFVDAEGYSIQDAYLPNVWWLRIEDVAPPEVGA